MKKYKLTTEVKEVFGRTFYRIEALKSFGNVKKGDLGGFIEREENLSHDKDCWVYGNAWVYDGACVCGNARVYNNTRIYDNACVCDNARVYDNACVYGDACVCDNGWIYGNARIRGNAWVCDNAIVCGNACVCGNARVCESQHILSGVCKSNLLDNLLENIRCQTGLLVVNNKVIAYKQVRKDLHSFYDNSFIYKIGEIVEVKDFDDNNKSCAKGLHFSYANYWNNSEDINNSIFLMAEIDLEDIITVQESKIRCKKAKILGKYDIAK